MPSSLPVPQLVSCAGEFVHSTLDSLTWRFALGNLILRSSKPYRNEGLPQQSREIETAIRIVSVSGADGFMGITSVVIGSYAETIAEKRSMWN